MFRFNTYKKAILSLVYFSLLALTLASCQSETTNDKNMISVMIENGPGFSIYDPILTQERGSDFTFKIKLEDNTFISWVSYELYNTTSENEFTYITFEDVMYPTVITIKTTTDYVVYHGDGGTFNNGKTFFEQGKNENHLKFNTLSGHDFLKREGYQLDGWETISGEIISLGSRANRKIKHLKAKWLKETDISEFSLEQNDSGYTITKYLGNNKEIIIPSYHKNLEINRISKNAFINLDIDKIFISPTVTSIESGSFANCKINNFHFYDNLNEVIDSSFTNTTIKKIKINATRRPRYSGTFYDTFSDKIDYLEKNKDKKKIILFSGSSTRYGYDSTLLKDYFPSYEVVNMGVYAYFSAKIQLDIIDHFLKPGDIIIDAPEFDASKWQMFEHVDFEKRIFNMFEANYDNLKYLDITKFGNFFDSFSKFELEKNNLPPLDYNVSAMHLDDDGNYHEENIYNENGDFILNRDGEVKEGIISQHPLAYIVGTISNEQYKCFNEVYRYYKDKGIKLFFNYAPRNIDSLTKNSTPENRKLFEKEIIENIEAPFLSTMDDFLYKPDHFYLIDNHLTSEGARKRTILTAENLAKFLKD